MDPRSTSQVFEIQNTTYLDPLALALTMAMGLILLWVRPQRAVLPMFVVAVFITNAQRIAVGGVDFDMLRILILFGFLRASLRGEWGRLRLNGTDRLFLVWMLARTLAYIAMTWSLPGAVYALGYAFTGAGLYVLFRIYIRGMEGVRVAVLGFALISIPLALAMLNEQMTGRNLFSIFGGVSSQTFIREGRLRSQGAFSHPILAGSFGASVLPLMWGLAARCRADRSLALAGAVAAVIIVLTSSSSGPIMAMLMGMLGLALWTWRRHIRALLLTGLAGLVVLDQVMTGPVYALIWRVSVIGGSKGYHRYHLIDQAVKRFGEWWLVGVPSTAHWGYGLFDVTNRYIREGVDGGIFSLLLFVAVMGSSFRTVVRAGNDRTLSRGDRFLAWALGASLLTHAVSFLAVSYFGQMMFFWYLPVAMISAVRDLQSGRRSEVLREEVGAHERV